MLLVSAALGGCLSPTLPLPPPTPDVSAPDTTGQAHLTGQVPSYAYAEAINIRTNEIAGQVTDASGNYDFTIGAQIGDELHFFYEKGGERSDFVAVLVPAQ